MSNETVVYWLFDETCICPRLHGYVGISDQLVTRLSRHRKAGRLPTFSSAVLFTGTRDECLEMEARLRPACFIGWNWEAGGRAGGTAPKSSAHRAKMSAAARARYSDPAERERARQYQVGKHDHRGENNPRFGKPLAEEVKLKISASRKGKAAGNQNWLKRKPYTEQALLKMSEASKRRWRDHPRP